MDNLWSIEIDGLPFLNMVIFHGSSGFSESIRRIQRHPNKVICEKIAMEHDPIYR